MSYMVRIHITVNTLGEARLFEDWANNKMSMPDKPILREVDVIAALDENAPQHDHIKGEANDQDT